MQLSKIRKLAFQFDRPGWRWVLASLLPVLAKSSSDGVLRLSYKRGGWEHHFEGVSSVEPTPRLRGYHLREAANLPVWGFLYTPKPGDTIVDIGAGLGDETVYFAEKVGPSGRVISVEAHPLICGFLRRTVELNEFKHAAVLNLAVADKNQVVSIENDLEHHLGNAILQNGGVPVQALPLDQICHEHALTRIDFLKMNIEGAERLAVAGMSAMVSQTAVVAISCHDFKWVRTGNEFFRTKAIVEEFFRDNGFIIVPRDSPRAELANQVNAYNPNLINIDALNCNASEVR
ncbi:FkbM family methyltransferase [Mesorhizobium sp. M0959]|uniref:FkbM family methyltransferase n=1 Tax=unclassified Mesorhizobium TaxID=325217 RepID=UPI00333D06DE